MAQRRMMSLRIIDTDRFMDMPLSTQCLYFHLMIRADDDGFLGNKKKILRMVGANDDDMNLLESHGFVIPFQTGVCVITHWKVHNNIRSDRYTETIYTDEKKEFMKNLSYQMSYHLAPQVRLGKVRLGKVSSDTVKSESVEKNQYSKDFEEWWTAYPKKIGKGGAYRAWKRASQSLPALSAHVAILVGWTCSEKWKDDGGRYIPNPQTWINERRWDDTIPESVKTSDERYQAKILEEICR